MSLIKYARIGLASVLLSIGLSGQAAVVHVVEGGQLVGATGIDIGGTLYDVSFEDGTFADLYSGVAPPFHSNPGDASAFATALLGSVFQDLGTQATAFDSDPSLTHGCAGSDPCTAYIPWAPFLGQLAVTTANNHIDPALDAEGNAFAALAFDSSQSTGVTWAVFSVSQPVATVPEPSTYAMLLVGILMLAGFSPRSNRA